MDYFEIDLQGTGDEDACFTNHAPNEINSLMLIEGVSMKGEYPDDSFEVTLELDEDNQGLDDQSLLGNTDGILILKNQIVEEAKKFDLGEIEFLPFTLLSHKKRVHSKEYCFVNPLGTHDILNYEKSEIKYLKSGKIFSIPKVVLSSEKLLGKPDLLRLKESSTRYFFSSRLVDALSGDQFTNLLFEKIEMD